MRTSQTLRNKPLTRTVPSPTDGWARGFAQGKDRGARFHSLLGPVSSSDATSRDRLRARLAELLVKISLSQPITADELLNLRREAVAQRENDWDGVALAAIAVLSDRGDPAATAWLQVMLAGAGRYAEALRLEPGFPDGRPPASAYLVLVNALALLGRDSEAVELMTSLTSRFPGLAADFVSRWDATVDGAAFDGLISTAPKRTLPVFYHLPFCGGTSMIVSLKQALPWSVWLEVGRRYGLYQLERALSLPAEDAAKLRLVHLHHPFALQLPGRHLDYFTVLRDPVDQLASGFHKRLESSKIVPTRDDSSDLAAHADYTIRSGLTNQSARQLVITHPELEPVWRRRFRGPGAFHTVGHEEDMLWVEATADIPAERLLELARETLTERFGLVGTMKHLAASHLAAAARIGLPVTRRIVHRGSSRRSGVELSPAVERRLRTANWVDQTLYEEYTAAFESDHRDLISAVEDRDAE